MTLHIRKAGWWTKSLYQLAAAKKGEIEICMEGPYGSVGVDLQSDKYGMVLLFSGGIGVTPMQSICHQLMYEHNSRKRTMKKLSFVWIERDPQVFEEVDVVRCSTKNLVVPIIDLEDGDDDGTSLASAMTHMAMGGDIATTLLSTIPQNRTTDAQLELEYPPEEFQELEEEDDGDRHLSAQQECDDLDAAAFDGTNGQEAQTDCRVLNKAYSNLESPLDLQVYLTSKNPPPGMPPFVHYGRPDVKGIFQQLRNDALAAGERRVAVCACAPMRLVKICQKACAKYSDRKVTFDFHYEVFD